MTKITSIFSGKKLFAGLLISLMSAGAMAETYEVTLTNLTKGQAFTPRLAVTHSSGKLFSLGAPAIEQIVAMAEGGDISPLMTLLESFPDVVTAMSVGDGLLMPGDDQTIMIEGEPGDLLSMINMIIPTNDGFIALNGVALPTSGRVTHMPSVYDAGSESNDELCSNIPGPVCGGIGDSPEDDGEGYIYTHPGIHGHGDLAPGDYDWRNPAARIVIRKI